MRVTMTAQPEKGELVNDEPMHYKPGDVVNGYMLSAEGSWLPVGLGPAAQAALRPSYGHASPSVVYVQADSSNNTSLAPVTSLVSGLIGLFLCWIPLIGIIGWVLGPIALTFGILGLKRGKAEHKIMSWIGIACGALTVLVCMLYVAALVGAFSQSQ